MNDQEKNDLNLKIAIFMGYRVIERNESMGGGYVLFKYNAQVGLMKNTPEEAIAEIPEYLVDPICLEEMKLKAWELNLSMVIMMNQRPPGWEVILMGPDIKGVYKSQSQPTEAIALAVALLLFRDNDGR